MVPHCVPSDSVHHDYTRITLKASVVLLCIARLNYFSGLGEPRFCTRLWCRASRIGVFTSLGCGSGQCTTPSALIIGKPAHGRASQAESRLLCLSAFPSRQGVLSPSCRTPGLEYPDCGSPFSFPRVRVYPWEPSLPGAQVLVQSLFFCTKSFASQMVSNSLLTIKLKENPIVL